MINTQNKPQDTKAQVVKPTEATVVKEVVTVAASKDTIPVKTEAK